ncbi:unnamed protein product [Cylicocyclus nassatus]|uniref:Uncharacterized protein n=1 Tax=Cylicocyclus nassatus TaxID=53992 RepID=A0AA36MG55_CYLNA|nr:unnamed protein product [Cylicocyclus nassatus]
MSCVLYMNSTPLSEVESIESTSNHEDGTVQSLESGTSCYANSADTASSSSTPPATAPLKKFRNVRKSNIYSCVVCGDKPTGYHYDVLSCNGCKTFFRRTIINNRKFSCTKGGTCQFNKDFRCACRACRFAKCINVGMNAKGIQFPSRANVNIQEDCDEPTGSGTNTDMDLSQDCTTVETYSPKRSDTEGSPYGSPVGTRLQCSIPHLDLRITEDFKLMNIIDSLVTRENCTKYLRRLDYPVFCESTLKKILKEPTIIGRLKFDKNFSHSQLNQYRENPIKFWMVVDLFLAVEYAKTFQSFANLCEDDKQKLLAHAGGLIVIASQAFYTLEQKEESITFPDGINALRVQLQQNGRHQFANYYRETYARPVDLVRTLNMTREQFALFKAILLFSPNDLDLTPQGRAEIDIERERLTSALRKCLLQELGPSAGFEKLANILLAIATLVELTEKRRNYLEVCDLMSTVTLSSLAKSIYLKRFNL